MKGVARILALALSLAALSSTASAYYYWTFFTGRTAPFTPVPARFDLTALPNNTVSYFISDQPPSPMMPDDSFTALVSQIQLAASVWNNVTSSGIRLAFGGIGPSATPQSTPSVEIVFDDDGLPPGLLAQTLPTFPANLNVVTQGNTSFVPMAQTRIQLHKNLTTYQQASYYDSFFQTLVHEFGHALGLQHSLTSGVMATQITSGTKKGASLSPDDIAGISLLYPTGGSFAASTGSISGQVMLSGQAVNLASVVAISTFGVSVSALTNPDGTYTIGGIPPGQYYVYAHPLPAPAQGEGSPDNIFPPEDLSAKPFPANTGFDTEFFPATRDWTQAGIVPVTANNVSSGISFNMQSRPGPAVYAMQAYGFTGQVAVQAPPLVSGTRNPMAFYAVGATTSSNKVTPGLSVGVLGGVGSVEPGSLQYYTQGYLEMTVDSPQVGSPIPAAFVVTVPNDMYVLPYGFIAVPSGPPVITSVNPGTDANGNLTANIAGSNLGTSTTVLLDGASASLVSANPDGSLTVHPPPANGGYIATVEALNPDGQTSSQALGSTGLPPTFAYPFQNPPSISLSAAQVTAGTDQMVVVTGVNTNFTDGLTVIGFGSSDISVKHTWVISPASLLMNISARYSAPATMTSVTVTTGLQQTSQSLAFQILSGTSGQVSLQTPILNQATGLPGVPVGGSAVINTIGLAAGAQGWSLTIGSQSALFTIGAGGQIFATVPPNLPTGPAVVQLLSPTGLVVPPVFVQVDPPPPVILTATNATGAAIGASDPAHAGDLVTLLVAGLSGVSSVNVTVAGVAAQVNSVTSQGTSLIVSFVVPADLPTGVNNPVAVQSGTRVSFAFPLAM